MRSSSSVVTPGTMAAPTSSRACAASRPATRIFSMVSASLTSLPVNGAGRRPVDVLRTRDVGGHGAARGDGGAGGYSTHAGECSFTRHERLGARSTGSASPTTPSRAGTAASNADRLGPYATAAEASRALEKVEERNEEWDNDPKWNDEQLED